LAEPNIVHNDIITNLLDDAAKEHDKIIKNEHSVFVGNNVNFFLTLTGIAINATPMGFIFNQFQTIRNISEGLYNNFRALYGSEKNSIFYLLATMRQNLEKPLQRAIRHNNVINHGQLK
jgi:hypothetical protein